MTWDKQYNRPRLMLPMLPPQPQAPRPPSKLATRNTTTIHFAYIEPNWLMCL